MVKAGHHFSISSNLIEFGARLMTIPVTGSGCTFQCDFEPVVVSMLPGCRAEPTAILLLGKVL